MWCCVSFLILAEIVFGDTYVLSVQYSCAVVSVFWLWREIIFKMRTGFYKKKTIGLLYYDPLANVCISLDLTLFNFVSFYFVYISCTAQIHKLKFKSEYYLRINIGNRAKNKNTGNHTLIS